MYEEILKRLTVVAKFSRIGVFSELLRKCTWYKARAMNVAIATIKPATQVAAMISPRLALDTTPRSLSVKNTKAVPIVLNEKPSKMIRK